MSDNLAVTDAEPAPITVPSLHLDDVPPIPPEGWGKIWMIVRRVLLAVGVLTAVGGLVALLVRAISVTSQLVVILACGVPFLTLVIFIGAGLMGALRSWILFVVNGVLAIVLVIIQIPGYVSDGAKIDTAKTVRILSGNLRLGEANAEDIVSLARRHDAQVVALQELTPEEVDRLRASGLDKLFPYSVVSSGPAATGVGLWSQTPISEAKQHYGFTFHLVSAVINVGPDDPVTFFSTHMAAPWPQNPYGWAMDLDTLGKLLRSTSGPIVDAGDFNATPDNAQFRHLLSVSNTKDASDESGSAPTFSYPADVSLVPPLIAIDHVLVRTVAAHSVKTVSLPGSDHRGLVSVVGFRS